MSNELLRVTWKAEVLVSELRGLLQSGPIIRIVHRFREPGAQCRPGEEVWAAFLIVQGKEIPLRLTLALRLLLDYLARSKHVPQSAAQIAAGMRASEFYLRHSANGGVISRRKFARSSIKEYVKRVRRALEVAFSDAGYQFEPSRVLVSLSTFGNERLYQLRARIELVHI
jgi:hypothetical protein